MDATCDIDLFIDQFGIDAVESSTKEAMNTDGTWEDLNGDGKFLAADDDRHEKALDIAGVDLKITKTSN
jgi:hypothetical protein